MQAPFYAGATAAEAKAKANARRWGSVSGSIEGSEGTSEDFVVIPGVPPEGQPKAKSRCSPPGSEGVPANELHAVSLSDEEAPDVDMADGKEEPKAQELTKSQIKRHKKKAEAKAKAAAAAAGGGAAVKEEPKPKAKPEATLHGIGGVAEGGAKGEGKGDGDALAVKQEKETSGAGSSSSGGVGQGVVQVKSEPKPKAKPETTLHGIGGVVEGGAKGLEPGLGLDSVPPNFIPTDEKPDTGSPVQCVVCFKWLKGFKWARTEKVIVINEFKQGDPDDEITYKNTCVVCLVKQFHMEPGEAVETVINQRVQVGRQRTVRYKQAVTNIKENWSTVSAVAGTTSRSSIRVLARSTFCDIFAPWAAIIEMKCRSMEVARGLFEEFDQATRRLREVMAQKDPEAINVAMKELDSFQAKIDEANRLLAFRDRGEHQEEYIVVCTYADEWLTWAGYRFRSYYVCGCGCVCSSKMWTRKFPELAATKQRWYCVACSKRYKTTFGTLLELLNIQTNTVTWMKGDVPSMDIEDIRAMALERQHGDVKTPQELWNRIESYSPATGADVVRPCTVGDLWAQHGKPQSEIEDLAKYCAFITPQGQTKLSQEVPFCWDQLYTFIKQTPVPSAVP